MRNVISMITERVECLECRFCHGLVGTEAGEVRKLERHLVDTHDILFNKQLSLATFFITTEEVTTILANLESRISLFKTKGLLDLQNNVLEKKEKYFAFTKHKFLLGLHYHYIINRSEMRNINPVD